MPFLDEDEWSQITPYLENTMQAIKDYRKIHNCDLFTARLNCKPEAKKKFEELTGMPNIHIETIYHHRLKDLGEDCQNCGLPLRSVQAKLCANCGHIK